MDTPTVIRELGDAIFYVHAKDVAINPIQASRNGVLDTKSYARMSERSWKAIVSALRLAGYDDTLSIEHEDALASTHEGLSSAIGMLSRVLLQEPPVEAWWL